MFLERDEHAGDLSSKHLVGFQLELVEQDLVDEWEDEVPKQVSVRVGAACRKTLEHVLPSLLVEHRDILLHGHLDSLHRSRRSLSH